MGRFMKSGVLSVIGILLTIIGGIITGFADKRLIEETVIKVLLRRQ